MKQVFEFLMILCFAIILAFVLIMNHRRGSEYVIVPLNVCEHSTTAYFADGKQEHLYHCTWSEMK